MSSKKKKYGPALWLKAAGLKVASSMSKRAAMKRIYLRERKFLLAKNLWCAWGLKQNPKQFIRATQIHHTRGRRGKLLIDQRFWLAVSADGHEFIHKHPYNARSLGLLCEVGDWNKPAPL